MYSLVPKSKYLNIKSKYMTWMWWIINIYEARFENLYECVQNNIAPTPGPGYILWSVEYEIDYKGSRYC